MILPLGLGAACRHGCAMCPRAVEAAKAHGSNTGGERVKASWFTTRLQYERPRFLLVAFGFWGLTAGGQVMTLEASGIQLFLFALLLSLGLAEAVKSAIPLSLLGLLLARLLFSKAIEVGDGTHRDSIARWLWSGPRTGSGQGR